MLLVVAHGGEEVADVLIVERVDDVAAGPARAHEPQRAQQPQIMGRRTGAEAHRGGALLDGPGFTQQLGEQAQAGR